MNTSCKNVIIAPITAALLLLSAGCGRAVTPLVEWVSTQEDRLTAADYIGYLQNSPASLLAAWRTRDGRWEAARGWKLSGTTLQADNDQFEATLTPTVVKGGLEITCSLTAKRDVMAPCEVALFAPFAPGRWRRQFYPGVPYRIYPPETATTQRFLVAPGSWVDKSEPSTVDTYPFGVLENDRTFLLWGSLDIGKPDLLMPNLRSQSLPAVCARQSSWKSGETLRLDLFVRAFPKSRFPNYRDVLHWYIMNWEDTDPVTAGMLVYKGQPGRPMPKGNLVSLTIPRPITKPDGTLIDPQRWTDYARSAHAGSGWYYAWHKWDETYPTEGEWYGEANGIKTSAQEMRARVQAFKALGVQPMMYFRAAATEQGLREDQPPYRKWLDHPAEGLPEPEPFRYTLSPDAAKEAGIDRVNVVGLDLGNPEVRDWYLATVKRFVDFYLPGGLGFDFGWAIPALQQSTRFDPHTSKSHSVVKLQMDIFRFLAANHPEMRIVLNESYGTPSQLFADAVMLENFSVSGKSELDFEASRAIGTTTISYDSYGNYAEKIQPLPKQLAPFLSMRYRAHGIAKEGAALQILERPSGVAGVALKFSDLNADGEWHVTTVDLKSVPQVEKIKDLVLQVQAVEDTAFIDVDYIGFAASPQPPAPDAWTDMLQFPKFIDSNLISLWKDRPYEMNTYLPRPANPAATFSLEPDKEGFVRFSVQGKGTAMSWEFQVERWLGAQEYMKTLALGGCIGGIVLRGLEPALTFSAEAMALPPVIDSLAVQSSDARVLTAAWADDTHALLAAYNRGEGAVATTLTLDQKLTARFAQPTLVLLDRFGQPDRKRSVQMNGNTITIRLERGAGLFVSSQDMFKP